MSKDNILYILVDLIEKRIDCKENNKIDAKVLTGFKTLSNIYQKSPLDSILRMKCHLDMIDNILTRLK